MNQPIKIMKSKTILLLVLFSMFLMVPFVSAQKLSAEEIVTKHLDSIGTAEKRSAFKSIVVSGEVNVDFITKKTQPTSGRIVLATEGNKMFVGMNLNTAEYPQERFVFDGDKSAIGMVNRGGRSILGNFIQSNTVIMSHGLLSGTLGSSWLFLNSAESKGKISAAGMKKIDGRETYGLSYSPKGGSDIEIKMYFDQETFRHVRTEYSATRSAAMGRTMDESARNRETRIKLIEDFGDFKESGGLMLPSKYKIFYSYAGQNETNEQAWNCVISEFAVNQKLDAGSFSTGQ
jgi:outer membrane lipoprotein-sorting protein